MLLKKELPNFGHEFVKYQLMLMLLDYPSGILNKTGMTTTGNFDKY